MKLTIEIVTKTNLETGEEVTTTDLFSGSHYQCSWQGIEISEQDVGVINNILNYASAIGSIEKANKVKEVLGL